MQRLLSLRLLTKKQPTSNVTCYVSKTNPIHPQNAYGKMVSHYSTTALSNSGIKPQNFYGFLSNSVLVNQFLQKSRALLKGPSKGLVDFKWVFSRSYFLQKKSSYNISSFKSFSQGRRWIQRLDSDHVVLGLIATNVAVFLLWRAADYQFMANNFMISLDNFRSGRVHTMITSAFSHMDARHMISNMIGLYFFGNSIGSAFGPEFLLKLYLAGALAGSVFYLVYHAFLIPSKSNQMRGMSPSSIPGLGASGAVNAIMLLDIFLNPKKTIFFEMIIPVPAILLGIFLIGKDMLRIIESSSTDLFDRISVVPNIQVKWGLSSSFLKSKSSGGFHILFQFPFIFFSNFHSVLVVLTKPQYSQNLCVGIMPILRWHIMHVHLCDLIFFLFLNILQFTR